MLAFPLTTGLELATTTLGDRVGVGALIDRGDFDQPYISERIQAWIEPAVMGLADVIFLEGILDCEAVRWGSVLKTADYVQEITLEGSQVVHHSILTVKKWIDEYIG